MSAEYGLVTGTVTAAMIVPDMVSPSDLTRIAASARLLLPGGWSPGAAVQTPEMRIALTATSGMPRVTVDAEEIVRIALRPAELRGDALAHIIYTVTEHARQRRGTATLHAAAAANPACGAVLLLGDKGAGKTSTLHVLIERGWTPLGDDLILLSAVGDTLQVEAGKTISAVRRRTACQHGYESKAPIDLTTHSAPGAGPQARLFPWAVTVVVRVSVHPHAETLVSDVASLSRVERLRLAENLARYITGTATPLALAPEVCAPAYPLDHPAATTTRSRLITAIGSVGLRYLQSSTAHRAVDLIEELMSR